MLDEQSREKIEELFRRHGKGVGSYVLARVGDPHAAEAVTAGVFLTVVRRFDQCQGSVVGWLWSIVRSELARHFRDKRTRGEVGAASPLAAEPADASDDPGSLAERAEDDGRMRGAIARLTEEQQQLIYMKFFLDMPNTAVAEAMGMTPSNVGVVAHRAVKRLRELMEEKPPAAARRPAPPNHPGGPQTETRGAGSEKGGGPQRPALVLGAKW